MIRTPPSAIAARVLPAAFMRRTSPAFGMIDAVVAGVDDRARALRMALAAYGFRVASAAIAYLSQILLARWMGGFEYGVFVVVWTWVTILGVIANLGFSTAVIRLIPEYQAKGEPALLRGVLLGSRVVSFAAGTLLAAFGAAGLWFFQDTIASYYILPFYLGLICVPLFTMTEVQDGIARAFNWSDLAFGPTFVWRPLFVLVCLFGVHLLGAPLTAVTAGLVTIGATWGAGLLQLMAMRDRGRSVIPSGPRAYLWRPWLALALPLLLIDSLHFLLLSTDILVLSQFVSPDEVAVYYAATKTLALVHFVYFAVKAASAHRYAHFLHAGDRAGLEAYVRDTVRWTFWPSLAVALLLLAIGRPLLALFGPGFENGYLLMFVLVLGAMARAAVGPIEALLVVAGQQHATMGIYVGAFAANLVLNYALVPWLGLWGAAIATSVVMAGEAVSLLVTVQRRLQLGGLAFRLRRRKREPTAP